MRGTPLAVSAAVLSVLALTLTACGPGTPTPTKSPTPEASASAEPTPEATETAAPEPVAATCENLLTTSLAEYSGIGISGPGAYADKLQSEGNPFYSFYSAGGVFCFVGEMEAYALYGWAPFDDASWAPIRSANLSEGWSEEVTDAGFLMRTPFPQPLQVCYYRPNQFGACAVSDAVLDEIITNAPS
jgi:hypothetical protein